MARSSSTIRRFRKFAPSIWAGVGALSAAVVIRSHLVIFESAELQSDEVQSDEVRSNEVESDLVKSDLFESDVVRSDAVPGETRGKSSEIRVPLPGSLSARMVPP